MAETVFYPDAFPLPEDTNYTGLISQGMIRSATNNPFADQRATFNRPTQTVNLTFFMPGELALFWVLWVSNNGWRWFYMPLVSDRQPDNITSWVETRFIGQFQASYAGFGVTRYSVQAEIMMGAVPVPSPGQDATQSQSLTNITLEDVTGP